MAIKRPKPKEIVVKSRQVEVLVGQDRPRIDAIRQISVTEQTYSRWSADNGPEFVAAAGRGWIKAVGAKTAYIEPGSPWKNGYC